MVDTRSLRTEVLWGPTNRLLGEAQLRLISRLFPPNDAVVPAPWNAVEGNGPQTEDAVDQTPWAEWDSDFLTIVEQHAAQLTLSADSIDRSLREDAYVEPHCAAIGDSITDDRVSWFEILATAADAAGAGARFTNLGQSGARSSDLLRLLPALVDLKPALVIVAIGTNDASHGGWAGTDTAVSLTETKRNLSIIDNTLRTASGMRVVWLTPPPIDLRKKRDFWPKLRGGADNTRIADIARHILTHMSDVVDAHGRLSGRVELADLFEDGVHPTPKGHLLLAEMISSHLGWRSG